MQPRPDESSPIHDETTGRGAGIAAVVVAVLGFSWGFIFVKLVGLPPPILAFWRLLIGAGALTLVAALLRVPFPHLTFPIVLAGLAFGAHQLVFIAATSWTSVAIVTLIAAAQPLVVALVSRRTVGEPVSRSLVGYSVLALVGVAIVVHANRADASRSLLGDLLAVANLFIFTTHFLAAKRARMADAPTLTFTASFLWLACVVVIPALFVVGIQLPDTRQTTFLCLLALGSGNGHLLLNWAHPRVAAALSSLILAAVPLLSSIWAHLVLGEPYGWRHVAGMLLVIAAIEGGRRATMRSPLPSRLHATRRAA